MKYKCGQIVIKKASGNKMTIHSLEGNRYYCFWFLGKHLHQAYFEEKDICNHDEYERILNSQKRIEKINKIL
jgi:uncharacterized protein YodC (DUF2158 family)